jgi:hypothetical protein
MSARAAALFGTTVSIETTLGKFHWAKASLRPAGPYCGNECSTNPVAGIRLEHRVELAINKCWPIVATRRSVLSSSAMADRFASALAGAARRAKSARFAKANIAPDKVQQSDKAIRRSSRTAHRITQSFVIFAIIG